jgi:hypothetical protein
MAQLKAGDQTPKDTVLKDIHALEGSYNHPERTAPSKKEADARHR